MDEELSDKCVPELLDTIQGKVVGIRESLYTYTGGKLFVRATQTIDVIYIDLLVKEKGNSWLFPVKKKFTVMIPIDMNYSTMSDVRNQNVRYTKTRTKHDDERDGPYKLDEHILEILSGPRKNNKYNGTMIV